MKPLKIIITNKAKLAFKYGKEIATIEKLLKDLIAADLKNGLKTMVVYVDDNSSAKTAGVKKIKNNSEAEYKRIVDDLYEKHVPAYIVLLGAQDIVPFQTLDNTADDDDATVSSDLPYACDAKYSRKIQQFTGPTRVVGRIPDIPNKQTKAGYLTTVINNIIQHKPYPQDEYYKYFAISANVWQRSTELSLQNMFGDSSKLISSPNGRGTREYKPYNKKQLAPMVHFYNCHGGSPDINYYGQLGDNFPVAINSQTLPKNIKTGTVIAAECCFGAELVDSIKHELPACSIANNYLLHGAIAFVGSSTIAYGPADSQSLADLITQYFISSILKGASSGRAMLEARQKFLSESGDLDPVELKTVAQFYLLGDPSVQPAESEEAEVKTMSLGNMVTNNRKRLFVKGKNLEATISKSVKLRTKAPVIHRKEVQTILANTGFTPNDKSSVYKVMPKKTAASSIQKKLEGRALKFHTYVQEENFKNGRKKYRVLVVKENENQVLGYRTYFSK
jgi:hypothetical protein